MPPPLDEPLAGGDPAALERLFAERAARRLRALIEAALFASPEPVTVSQLARSLGEPEAHVQGLLEDLAAEYRQPEHGIFVRPVRGGFQMATKPEHDADLRELLRGFRPRAPLSRPALETLADIGRRNPGYPACGRGRGSANSPQTEAHRAFRPQERRAARASL
jgi:hypothetical protein